MRAYRDYCNRRGTRKGLKVDDIPCCPTRLPIIGPILFSLFIFSPFILPTSEADKNSEMVTDSMAQEVLLLPNDHSLPQVEITETQYARSQPVPVKNLKK